VPPAATRVPVAASPTRGEATVIAVTPAEIGASTVTPAEIAASTVTPTSLLQTPATRAATATRLPASPTLTLSPSPTVSPTETIALSPSPRPPFQQVAQVAEGAINGLWAAPDGTVWVPAADGIYSATTGGMRRLAERPAVAVLGQDPAGRIWVLFDEGETIGAYQGGSWAFYGQAQGWEAAPAALFGRGEAVVVDRLGGVWLALGRAGLRHLDPASGSWRTLRGRDVGYAPPPAGEPGLFGYDPHLAFTGVAVDSFGNIWTSACAVRVTEDGPFPLLLGEGQGARWFDGEGWAGPGESSGRCVQDIEVDGNGVVWLAGRENNLWQGNVFIRYEPDSSRWVRERVPESVAEYAENPRFVGAFWFDNAGRLWMRVERRGGATFPPDAVYYREGEVWRPFLTLLPGEMAGSPESGLWLFLAESAGDLEQGLYRYGTDGFAPLSFSGEVLDPATLTVDRSGRAWFSGRDGRSLWYYDGTGGP